MRVSVLGSSGFIGSALHSKCAFNSFTFFSSKSNTNFFSIFDKASWQNILKASPDTVLIASWPGLPNYNKNFHISVNLLNFIELIDYLIEFGVKKFIGLGTCYEYGNISGELFESSPTNPNTCYGIAKDAARRYLQLSCENHDLKWAWLRIFYPYGLGQNSTSLYPSLMTAIEKKETNFPMSSGRQIRDFINIDYLIDQILAITMHPESYGIYNCGSGKPISTFDFAQSVINQHDSKLRLVRNVFPDRAQEPFAFWASMSRYHSLIKTRND